MSARATGTVSKAALKARALEILRRVEASGEPVIITDRGRPVLRIEPFYGEEGAALESLRGSVLAYQDPTEPLDPSDWEVLT